MTYKLLPFNNVLRLADQVSIPPDPRNTDYAEYLEWLAAGNIPEPADPPIKQPLLKTTLYSRMTDAELQAADTFIDTQVPLRMRRMFNDAVELNRDDPDIIAALTILYGAERAAQLLA